MNKIELIEQIMIGSIKDFIGVSAGARQYQKDNLLQMRPDELVFSFNHCSSDCHIEYLGGNEYIVTVNPKKSYF